MRYIIRKASDPEYLDVQDFTLESLNTLASFNPIIIRENFFFGEPIEELKAYSNHSEEMMEMLVKCQMEILIYDDYIE